jgi:DNA (cytosine-5)-methyltransferase 1
MYKLKVLDLFSGIGGFSLGLERTGGFETVAFCEIEPFPRKVLAKHWPDVRCYHDVRELTAETLARDGIAVDVITGGFPCQDISVAGKQAGMDGTRSGLWSECLRLTSELRPRYSLFENVSNLLAGPTHKPGAWFSRILSDLAAVGYDAEWYDIPASYIGAWHRRGRIWILSYPYIKRFEGQPQKQILWQSDIHEQSQRVAKKWPGRQGLPSPNLCGTGDGISDRLHRLRGLGNAVVPQIPELIGNAILKSIHYEAKP